MSRERIVNLGVVQMQCAEDPAVNLKRALELTDQAIARGADIVCLPELFLSRYFCQVEDADYFELAEPIPGPSTDAFASVAKEAGVTILVSLFERRTPGLYHNTMAVVNADGYVGKYRKMHIPDDPRYYEKFYFAPGDLGFRTFDSPEAKLGTLICWDQWYPEAARMTALMGAEILFYPTAIGWHPEEKDELGAAQHNAWEAMQRSHAIANGCFVVGINRHGFEPDPASDGGIEFWGQSFIAAPDGRIVERAPVAEDAVMVVPINLGEIATLRHGWPFFRDRRIDAYSPLTSRFIDAP